MTKSARRRKYRGFPYRGVFRWGGLLFFLALIPAGPLAWYAYWYNYYAQTVSDLNQSASYRDAPGTAQAVTWHLDSYWPWVLLGAVILFLMYLYVFFWAGPKRDPRHSAYE